MDSGMNAQHQELAAGRWQSLSLMAQLGNVGSEVERAIKWKEKGNEEYSRLAFDRALELIDLTIADPKNSRRLREITRMRELLVDYFFADNEFRSTPKQWRDYFLAYAVAARVGR
jgi:hypothetical protein